MDLGERCNLPQRVRDNTDSVGILTGFSVGMGWVWGIEIYPHGGLANKWAPGRGQR